MAEGGRKSRNRRGRGEGAIVELPDGRFKATISLGKDGTGKRVRRSFYGKTKREALEQLRAAQAASQKRTLADPGRWTVGTWLDDWLERKKAKVEPATHAFYQQRVKNHLKPLIGDRPLGKLTPLMVEQLHADLTKNGVSAGEQGKVATTLRAALHDAVRLRVLPNNPASMVKKPRAVLREMVCLDADQARAFLTASAEARHPAFWALWLDTGMRPAELFALHWPDVDLDGGTVFVRQSLENLGGVMRLKPPKTKKGRRRIILARCTIDALRLHRGRLDAKLKDVTTGPVFPDKRGGFIDISNMRKEFNLIRAAAKLPPMRPYDLRHTSATLLLAAGVNIRVVSERLGHESIEITLKHYAHCLPSMQQAAADAVDGLFGGLATKRQPEEKRLDRETV